MGNGPGMFAMLDNPQMFAFLIPIVAIVGGLTFAAVVHWLDTQRKEREAYYKAETLRRVTEASGEGAKAAVELMQRDDRVKRLRVREGMKISTLRRAPLWMRRRGCAAPAFIFRIAPCPCCP